MPRLYAIVDQSLAVQHGWDLPELARAYLRGGARLLQVRAPDATSGELLAWCDEIAADALSVGAQVIVNDRADIAVLCGGAGVHLGQADLPPESVRGYLPVGGVVGLSTHTREQVTESARAPIDYVAVGPVFPTRTKDTGYEPVGLDLVSFAAMSHGGRPVVAIGGITLEQAKGVVEAGASSVAVASDLVAGGSPSRRVADYVRLLDGER